MKRHLVFVLLLLPGTLLAAPAQVSLTPPNCARFLVDQRFDLRVEGKGTGPFSATLSIDGVPVALSSGEQNSMQTDDITADGWGGFNLRGYSSADPGVHTVTATFRDSTGEATVRGRFEILGINLGRGEGNRRGQARAARGEGSSAPIKNIILFLGDGMGVAHRTAARLVKHGVTAGQPDGFLAMDQFPGTGLVTTHSLDSIVTDSAPGMSCYSTGTHNNNGQEGVFPAHVKNAFYAPRMEYMAEYLHRVKGTSLGLVSTADLEDATPAANAVHTANRNLGTGIVDQYLDESDAEGSGTYGTGLAVLLGGGRRWFLPASKFGSSRSAKTDYASLPQDLIAAWGLPASAAGATDPERDLLQDFVDAGFSYADSLSSLKTVLSGGTSDKLLGLFGYGNMNVALDKIAKRRGTPLTGARSFAVDDYQAPDQPMLEEMTDAALRVLSRNPNGFVLMVEGAHIDKQAHAMDADRSIGETIELDNAVAVGRKFADGNPGTLILVLADHECSGFSLIGALKGGIDALNKMPSDSSVLDPATQPARQKAVAVYDDAKFPRYRILEDGYPATFDIDGKLLVGFGANADRYENWLTKPRPIIDGLLPDSFKSDLKSKGYASEPYQREESATGFFIRGQAAGRSQAVHTAADIPLSAYSSASRAWQDFVGVQTNTDVFFKIMRSALQQGGED